MNETRLLRIANRIDLMLRRELGEGIDVARLLKDALYARDVLLVCEAQPGSSLDSLARHFRLAQSEPVDALGQPSTFGDTSSFGSTLSGAPSMLDDDELPPVRRAKAPWFSPSRWLGR